MWVEINRYQRQCWGHLLAAMVRNYEVLLETQCGIAKTVLQTTTEVLKPEQSTTGCTETHGSEMVASHELVAEAVERRIGEGLSPPAEAYLVQNREKIDWTRYPGWARPADPDMFNGCSHEG